MTPTFDHFFRELWAINFPGVDWPGELPALIHLFNKLTELQGMVTSIREELPRPMRQFDEVMRAHDVLVQLLLHRGLGELLEPEVFTSLSLRAETLCWVLHHDHNTRFADCLAAIEMVFAKTGIVLDRHEDFTKGATKQ